MDAMRDVVLAYAPFLIHGGNPLFWELLVDESRRLCEAPLELIRIMVIGGFLYNSVDRIEPPVLLNELSAQKLIHGLFEPL